MGSVNSSLSVYQLNSAIHEKRVNHQITNTAEHCSQQHIPTCKTELNDERTILPQKDEDHSNRTKVNPVICSALRKSDGCPCQFRAKYGAFCGFHKNECEVFADFNQGRLAASVSSPTSWFCFNATAIKLSSLAERKPHFDKPPIKPQREFVQKLPKSLDTFLIPNGRWQLLCGVNSKGVVPVECEEAVYELGLSSNRGKNVCVVYVGETKNIHRRILQYQNNGSHLGERGFFKRALSSEQSVYFRWQATAHRKQLEAEYLNAFDYAWNTKCNGKFRFFDGLKRESDVEDLISSAILGVWSYWTA